ncbi:hypothetical protein [Nitratidesulfovibrio vulgaris]|uniref:Uncharacterized protein n=1 Tax=Nitratidesulfovibrio vulgaris (strain ATCC 29579 / DSM 644 / CCUG 34227 / NCIMB 8303 / VKM B-1760 / Hildenborough) TaxID=882 RepID=Q72FH8_NITV2|nr:hypothetical protein [Nitratidesulfovibrio vulgaris]AAS94719.1 hypothetical protein DVU_0235 [Nitratidesulfovibrio vulgaris str. Hildenborough]
MYAQMIRDRLNDAFERAVRDCSKRVSTEWGDGVLFAGDGLDRFPAMLGEEIGAILAELRASRAATFVAAKVPMPGEASDATVDALVAPPVRKKDWPGCSIIMMADEPSGRFKEGSRLLVTRRMHSRDTMHTAQDISSWDTRVLKVEGRCPTCYALHAAYIPEHWIADGKAVFVQRHGAAAERDTDER